MASGAPNPAELYTEVHEDVRKSLEEAWNLLSIQDVESFLKFFDHTFKGYRPETPFPVDKSWMEKWAAQYVKHTKLSAVHFLPHSIQVFEEDLALVICGLTFIEESLNGTERQFVSQRQTIVMRRKTKRWAMISAHVEIIG